MHDQLQKTLELQKLMRDPAAILALIAENEALRKLLKEASDELRELKASVGFRAYTLTVLERIDTALSKGEQP